MSQTVTFPVKPQAERRIYLHTLRETMILYLRAKVQDEEWHGVCDAAMDLRDIDAELKGLERG